MIKTKEEISDLYKKTFKHSQFIEHSKIEDFIHQIREEDRNIIEDEMRKKWGFESSGNVEYEPSYKNGYKKCLEEVIRIVKNEIGLTVDTEKERYVKCYIEKWDLLQKLDNLNKE